MNQQPEDGGPAFPSVERRGEYEGVTHFEGPQGMSLRDYFAGQAIVGSEEDGACDLSAEAVAERAYRVADAMLAARTAVPR